jgi:hypothetical protein
MNDKPTTRIEAARQRVRDAEAAIAALENQVSARVGELGILRATVERDGATPELMSRIQATESVIDNLRSRLPRPGAMVGLQFDLDQAREHLEQTRQDRQHLRRRVERLEQDASRWADILPGVIANLAAAESAMNRAGWPAGVDNVGLLQVLSWARSAAAAFDSLPALRQRLETFGDDPERDAALEAVSATEHYRLWHSTADIHDPAAQLADLARG